MEGKCCINSDAFAYVDRDFGPDVSGCGRLRLDVNVTHATAYSQETALPAVGGQQACAFIWKSYQRCDSAALAGELTRRAEKSAASNIDLF
jgi:hypothetical protein